MEFLVSYASKKVNEAEKNDTTIVIEGLGMVYTMKMFRQNLLTDKFVFSTNH